VLIVLLTSAVCLLLLFSFLCYTPFTGAQLAHLIAKSAFKACQPSASLFRLHQSIKYRALCRKVVLDLRDKLSSSLQLKARFKSQKNLITYVICNENSITICANITAQLQQWHIKIDLVLNKETDKYIECNPPVNLLSHIKGTQESSVSTRCYKIFLWYIYLLAVDC
jgi:hypothetical protein